MQYEFDTSQWNEQYIEEINNHDFIKMKSDDFFEKILDFPLENENTLFIVVGSDSGLLLPWLVKQPLGRGSKIIVIEHDDVYPLVSSKYRGLLSTEADTENSIKSLSLYSHSQWQEDIKQSVDSSFLLAGKLAVVESHASSADYSRLYMPIHKSVMESSQELVSRASLSSNHLEFTTQQFKNLLDNTTPLKRSLSFGQNKTAIILGGGPSIDLHIDWVVSNRDMLFILAVSRVAPKLIKHDIKPDALVSVDPNDLGYEMCKQAVLWTDVPLLYNFHVSPMLLQQWQGPVLYMGKRLPWDDEKALEGCIAASGPTVSHAATFAASQLGFSTILMTGVDLCYTESGVSHTADSPEQYIRQMPSFCSHVVETYSGRKAATNRQMYHGFQEMQELGKHVNRHTAVLFNLHEEAAKCLSIPHMSIDNVELNEKKPQISDHIGKPIYFLTTVQIDAIEKELKVAKHAFSKMRALCKSAKSQIKEISGGSQQSANSKNSIKLTKIRKQIENTYSNFLGAIIYTNSIAFNKTKLPTDFSDMSQEEIYKWGNQYYTLIEQGAKQMSGFIDSVAPKVQLRRDEINPDISIRDIAKLWREDGTPGRILRWKAAHAHRLAGSDKAWVQRAVGKYRSTLNDSHKQVGARMESDYNKLQSMLRSIEFFNSNKKINELKAIEPRMAIDDWPYCALHPYICGLIVDLQGNRSEACANYQQAIDICSNILSSEPDKLHEMQRLIEECLVKMTQCYLDIGEPHSAVTTLGLLCEMLPSYVVSYAKMLNLVGEHKYAIELLESYVELYPTNKKASFLLSTLQSDVQEQTPTDNNANPEDNQQYVQSINGAMQAIMG